eukprot:gene6242-7757_t
MLKMERLPAGARLLSMAYDGLARKERPIPAVPNRFMPTPTPEARASPASLAVLFLCTAMPMAMWNVPLANVFAAHGRGDLVPWVLATSGIAAFISPLFVGALADQKMSATRLMRWLTVGTGLALCLT